MGLTADGCQSYFQQWFRNPNKRATKQLTCRNYSPLSCLTLTFPDSDIRYLHGLLSNPLLVFITQFRNKNRPCSSDLIFWVQSPFHITGKSSASKGKERTLPASWYLILRWPGTSKLVLIQKSPLWRALSSFVKWTILLTNFL